MSFIIKNFKGNDFSKYLVIIKKMTFVKTNNNLLFIPKY